MINRRLCATAAVIALIVASSAGARESLVADVSPKVSMAPATVRVMVKIEPQAHDRSLTVEIDAPNFYRSSTRPLEGELAAHVHEFVFTGLPSGSYEVTCTLTTDVGQTVIHAAAIVGNVGVS